MTSQTKALLRRQKIMEALGEKLATSTASKVPADQAHLLPENHRHLAGKKEKEKQRLAARRKILPAFLRRYLTRKLSILKLKLLGWSLRASWSTFWWQQRRASATLVLKSSRSNTPPMWQRAWPIKLFLLSRKKNISQASLSDSGENISATSTCSATNQSRPHTWGNIFSATGRGWPKQKK